MKKLIPLLFLLASCASTVGTTAQQRVFGAQADYTALLAVAVVYESQPRCLTPAIQPCSDIGVVNEIRRADRDARVALDSAMAIVRTPGITESTAALAVSAAINGVKALSDILKNRGII